MSSKTRALEQALEITDAVEEVMRSPMANQAGCIGSLATAVNLLAQVLLADDLRAADLEPAR